MHIPPWKARQKQCPKCGVQFGRGIATHAKACKGYACEVANPYLPGSHPMRIAELKMRVALLEGWQNG